MCLREEQKQDLHKVKCQLKHTLDQLLQERMQIQQSLVVRCLHVLNTAVSQIPLQSAATRHYGGAASHLFCVKQPPPASPTCNWKSASLTPGPLLQSFSCIDGHDCQCVVLAAYPYVFSPLPSFEESSWRSSVAVAAQVKLCVARHLLSGSLLVHVYYGTGICAFLLSVQCASLGAGASCPIFRTLTQNEYASRTQKESIL